MEVVLNERSFPNVATKEEAKELFDHFFKFCIALHKLSLNHITSITKVDFNDFNDRELAPDFNFYTWLKTLPVQQQAEKSLFIKMLAENKKAINYPEISYNDQRCSGLGYASMHNLIAISFLSHEEWNVEQITVQCLSIIGDVLKEESKIVNHCSRKEHIIKFKIWKDVNFKNNNPKIIKDGEGNLDKIKFQKFLFPHIKASNNLVSNVEIRPNIKTKDWEDFYKKLVNLSPEERISIYLEFADNIATINGWLLHKDISQRNNRKVYKAGERKKAKYLGVDTENGAFEFHLHNGNGLVEFKFDGSFQKKNTHILIIP